MSPFTALVRWNTWGSFTLVALVIGLLAAAPVATAEERLRTGSPRLRDKGRRLAEQFSRETRAEADLREHGVVSYADRKPAEVGDEETFYVDKTDAGTRLPLVARLHRIGRQCLLYVEKGVTLKEEQATGIVTMFDERIHPTTTAWFGREWSPGIDGEPRITLLIVSGLTTCDGFFDPEDEYLRRKRPQSNEREMLTLAVERLENSGLEEFMGHLVAHELQHMIHWSHDPKESNWVDEGCAEFAATLYNQFPFTVEYFLAQPDRCLIDWDDTVESSNYGHVFLFLNYLITHASRLQERQAFVRAIVASRRTSVSGIDEALRGLEVPMAFNTLFRDFCAATYLNRAADPITGPFAYDPFTARHLEGVKKNPLRPKLTFDELKGRTKGKVRMWSSLAFAFRIPAGTAPGTQVGLSFTGASFEGLKGRNTFDVGVAFADSKRRTPPQVTWLTTRDNDVAQAVPLPGPGFDRMLVIVANRGPMKLPANEKQWPPLAFSLAVSPLSDSAAERARFEELHRPR